MNVALSGGIPHGRILADYPQTGVIMLTMLEYDDSLFAAMCAGRGATFGSLGIQGVYNHDA